MSISNYQVLEVCHIYSTDGTYFWPLVLVETKVHGNKCNFYIHFWPVIGGSNCFGTWRNVGGPTCAQFLEENAPPPRVLKGAGQTLESPYLP